MTEPLKVNGVESTSPTTPEPPGKKRSKTINASSFPFKTLQEAIKVPEAIFNKFKEEEAPLETVATLIGISPKSSNLRAILNAAEAYGLVTEEVKNETFYKVAETGRKIVKPTYQGEKEEALKKAILTPTLMSRIYNDYNKKTFPTDDLFKNALILTYKIPDEKTDQVKQILIENAKLAAVVSDDGIMNLSYAPTAKDTEVKTSPLSINGNKDLPTPEIGDTSNEDFENICFVISPIGEEDSVQRKHANTMLKHLITPVAEELNLKVVRADLIDKSGIINQQILQYISKSSYCIADLSFGNANVFYELGVRHTCLLPTIQIKRKIDKLPFDVAQGRTITIDVDDPYTIMDRIESAKKELREHLNKMIQSKGKDVADDNPIRVYLPELKVTISK